MRLLDQKGIIYQIREYEVDPNDLKAEAVAVKVGLPAEQVFKTLAVQGDRNGICLAVIPGTTELDFKALGRLTGDRKMDMIPLKDVQAVTGYIRGAVTALACKKDYPVYIDETAELWDIISISAGQRGIQIFLAPGDYIGVVHATIGDIARQKTPS
jgi:Cys-tRNA(Pro)/Cys-tRNA(Cys) deacylase